MELILSMRPFAYINHTAAIEGFHQRFPSKSVGSHRARRPTPDLRSALLLLLLLAMTSCYDAPEAQHDIPWRSPTSPTETLTLTDDVALCTTCISSTRIATLGERDGPGFLEERGLVDAVAVDGLGNYWVGQREAIKVFSPSGHYLRDVGRGGQGPLEFIRPVWIQCDDRDQMRILDIGTSRETVISSTFQLITDEPLPGFPREAALLGGGPRWVAQMAINTPDRLGLPLHVFEQGKILSSFGMSPSTRDLSLTPITSRRVLTTDEQGFIFAVNPYSYPLEVWRADGSRVRGYTGVDLVGPWPKPAPLSEENPPLDRVFDMYVDEDDYLWMGIWRARADWRDKVEERVDPRGRVALAPIEHDTTLYRTQIQVIDLASGIIVARQYEDEFLFRFLGAGLAASFLYDENWDIQVGVSRLQLAK